MRKLKFLLAAALVVGLAVGLSGDYVRDAFCAGPDPIIGVEKGTRMPNVGNKWQEVVPGYAYPGNVVKTCNGNIPSVQVSTYYFGYKRTDGFCITREVLANSPNEAWTCARAYCDTCRVESLTEKVKAQPSVFGSPVLEGYCLVR